MHEVTTSTQVFVTPLSFYDAYTLQNKIYEFAASSNKILLLKISNSKYVDSHAPGFVHTIFLISRSNLLIVYNCPPPKSLTWSAANWSTRDNSLHLNLFMHSSNTAKTLIYMVTCVFLWLPIRDQITNDFTSTRYIFYSLSLRDTTDL